MSLRDKLIEAMADTYAISHDNCDTVLDAVLGVLTEHTDEWELAYGTKYEEGRVRAIAKRLIRVLQEDAE